MTKNAFKTVFSFPKFEPLQIQKITIHCDYEIFCVNGDNSVKLKRKTFSEFVLHTPRNYLNIG